MSKEVPTMNENHIKWTIDHNFKERLLRFNFYLFKGPNNEGYLRFDDYISSSGPWFNYFIKNEIDQSDKPRGPYQYMGHGIVQMKNSIHDKNYEDFKFILTAPNKVFQTSYSQEFLKQILDSVPNKMFGYEMEANVS